MDAGTLNAFVLAQMAAESYLGDIDITDRAQVRARLIAGSNNVQNLYIQQLAPEDYPGLTRMTRAQAESFNDTYDVIDHLTNTWSGFSGTLLKNRITGEYVLSFRSTEYANPNQGGDWHRDGIGPSINGAVAGADNEIATYGFAVAQMADAEAYFRDLHARGLLTADANFSVTGYSLGGHLATVFAEAHASDAHFLGAVAFNSPGRGRIADRRTVKELVDRAYDQLLANNALLKDGSLGSIYDQSFYIGNYTLASTRDSILAGFNTLGLKDTPDQPTELALGLITQVFGLADFDDSTLVSNSGIHSSNYLRVFIEDQPDIQGLGLPWLDQLLGTRSTFGTTHSITLLADTLATGALLQSVDVFASHTAINNIFTAASNQRGFSVLLSSGGAESDSLEQVVQALAELYGADISAYSLDGQILRGDRGGDFANLTNRNAFFDAIGTVQAKVDTNSGGTLWSSDLSAAFLASAAKENTDSGLAYRYALVEGNGFILLKDRAFYDAPTKGLNVAGRLDMLSHGGQLSHSYIDDRSAYLERKNYYNVRNARYDLTRSSTNPGNRGDAIATAFDNEDTAWIDIGSGTAIQRKANSNFTEYRVFGNEGVNTATGGQALDRLYGLAGQDVLSGGKGADYLEGGIGFDTYRFDTDDGADTIFDADGKGLLARNGSPIVLGIKQSEIQWRLNGVTLTRSATGSDLEISFQDVATDRITVRDFNFSSAQETASLGIRLIDSPSAPENFVRTFSGDNDANTLNGSDASEAEEFIAFGGDDDVYADGAAGGTSAQGGQDFIATGNGRDLVSAGAGADWIEGGLAGDILAGNAGDDAIYGEASSGQGLTIEQAIATGETQDAIAGAADLESGDAGEDLLIAIGTADLLLGGDGSDVIVAGGGDDNIYGDATLAFADRTWSVTRTDSVVEDVRIIELATTNAVLTVNDSVGTGDVVFGGAGEDWIFAGAGDDYAEGGLGRDVIVGDGGSDILLGGAEDDYLDGDSVAAVQANLAGDDYLDGGAGNDVIIGNTGNDVLYGGAGVDTINGAAGDDLIIGGADNDVLVGGAGKDTYSFNRGDGRDQLFDQSTGSESSVLIFGNGFNPNSLKLYPGSMVLDFGNGDAIDLASFNHNDPNAPSAFERLVFADGATMSLEDVLALGFDIQGTEEDDDGHDASHPVLSGTAFKDNIRGLGGNDELQGRQGDDSLDGGAGDDRLFGMDGNDALVGGDGADALIGATGDDVLDGGAGRDALWGDAGNDRLDGGAGADLLIGGPGDDAYVFGAADSVFDYTGSSRVIFGTGINPSDLALRRQLVNGQPVYSVGLSSATTDAEKMFISISEDAQLAAFEFADGTVLDHEGLLHETWFDQQQIVGTAGNDVLDAYAGNDFVRGGAGNDMVTGRRGDDRLEGEAGDDKLEGSAGNDLMLGGAGADTLTGGAGNDQLIGGEGADIYRVARGEGTDTVSDQGDGTGDDVLRFTDATSANVSLARRANGDLVLTVAGGGTVSITGQYNGTASRIERIEFADATSLGLAELDALTVAPIEGTAGNDVLVGTSFNDTLLGHAGADTLDGASGDDRLEGGEGADIYVLGAQTGYDTLFDDGSEASTISLATGLEFGDVRARQQENDLVLEVRGVAGGVIVPGYYAEATNWTVADQAGQTYTLPDLLTYLDGITPPETVQEFEDAYLDSARVQYAQYLASFGANGGVVVNVQPPTDAAVTYRDAPYAETGTFPTFYLNIADITGGPSANTLDFQASRSVVADAEAADDLIDNQGFGFVNTSPAVSIGSFLNGNAGNDVILGTWDADTLLGGAGDDYVAGSRGNDTYVVFAADSGTDVLDEVNDHVLISGHDAFAAEDMSNDTLILADIPYSDATFTVGQFDSTSTSSGGHGQIFVSIDISWAPASTVRVLMPDRNNPYLSQFPNESYGVETIRFSDGTTITQSELLPYLFTPTAGTPGSEATINGTEQGDFLFNFNQFQGTTLNGFGGDDSIFGGPQSDVLDGGDGADFLSAGDGDDVILAGTGDDFIDATYGNDYIDGGRGTDNLNGGPGNDIYFFAPGFGQDTLWNFSPHNIYSDVISFGEGIGAADIGVTTDGTQLYLADLTGPNRITVMLAAPGQTEGWGVSRVEFHDGTVWSRDDLAARIGPVPASAFDDVIGGTPSADVLVGLAGSDYLLGLGGDDLIHGDEGDDDVEGGVGNDVVYGDQGDDFVVGDAGFDLLIGGDGTDDLEDWDAESDFMHAGAGDDYFYLESGAKFVIGGMGADWIDVFAPNSVVAFNRGDGEDTVYAADSLTLTLGGGIAAVDLTLEADGSDLILRAGGSDLLRLTAGSGPASWPAMRLQIVGEDVRVYDLRAVVEEYYVQSGSQPGLVLALAGVLPAYLTASSFEQAFGGDLAYLYGKGRLDESVSALTVLPVITDTAFGVAVQAITNPSGPPLSGGVNGGVVLGGRTSEAITGGAGSDWLDGGAGEDILTGGAGDDLLTGGAGADTYVYKLGDGVDTIADPGTGAANTVEFGIGITPDMVTLGLGSLLVRVGDAGGALHLTSFDPADPFGARDIDTYRFADNTVLSHAALLARGFDLTGSASADQISGTATVDRIRGGLGDDVLAGALGSDTYFYDTGDGADTIQEGSDAGASDVLRFGAGIESASLVVTRSGNDVVIELPSAGDQVTLSGWFTTLGGTIERVEFADASFWTPAQLEAQIVPSNQPPVVATPIPDQAATEDAQFTYAVPGSTFSDPDAGDTLAYTASRADGLALPAWLSFNTETRTFTGTPANADAGSVTVRVTATDGSGESVHDDFGLTVANTNDAPVVANAVADQNATEEAPFSFTVPADTFADVDIGDTLVYTASLANGSPLPGWLTFDAASQTFGGTPANDDVGAVSLKVMATDGAGLSVSDIFDLTVLNTNDAPTLANPIADQSATEDSAFSFTVPANTFADVDAGDSLAYSASLADGSALPAWLSFNGGVFSSTPLNADVGSYELRVTASDAGGLTAQDSFTLLVANVNDAPSVAVPLADHAFDAGASFVFVVPAETFADGDAGDTKRLSAALFDGGALPAWLAFDVASGTFSGAPQAAHIGISHIAVTATDAAGESATADFGLIVRAAAGARVTGDAGDDLLYGNSGDETLKAKGGNDYLYGDAGDDLLKGGSGNDLLQGGEGDDVLRGGTGQNVLEGGSGDDVIYGGQGASFIAGGAGNDVLRVDRGNDVIAFNLGDGIDTVYGGRDGGNTLSFGGGIGYGDLSFSKDGKDLVVNVGAADRVVLKNWYNGNKSVLNLQLIHDAAIEFDANSSNPLYNKKVQTFDFLGLVSAFDAAHAESPGVTSWALTNALLQWHLSHSDDEALGGDLAYWYGKTRALTGISVQAAQQTIGALGFGSEAQTLRPFTGLQEGFAKLA